MNRKPLTAYDAARQMDWSIRAENWDAFPAARKWFAMGKALTHLRYRESLGEIRRFNDAGVVSYGCKFAAVQGINTLYRQNLQIGVKNFENHLCHQKG